MFRQRWGLLLAVWAAAAAPASGRAAQTRAADVGNITLANEHVEYVLSAAGRTVSLRDRRGGKERCAAPGRRPFATVRKGGATHAPTRCTLADGKLTLRFDKPRVTLVVKVGVRKGYFVFELASASGAAVDEVSLLNLAVTPAKYVSRMSGLAADDEFAVCLRALNLRTRCPVGGRPAVLRAVCGREHGPAGAKVALVCCPAGEVRGVLKEVVRKEGLPQSDLGGPWALDAEANRGSYVFAAVSEKNVDAWIALAKKAGLAQIHFHPWWRTLGHYEPRASLFPGGLGGLKAAVAKVHTAGLTAGMHTLTGCISPNDPWATPVPDEHLAADATFTLAEAVDAKAAVLHTDQRPAEFDTVWAYGGRGNCLRVGKELILFTGLRRDKPPYGLVGCRRGAFGTKPAPHPKGARADHLFVRYGCFQPGEGTTLVGEVADCIARVFNTCRFDMIYMDGAEGMSGGWHGVAKMRAAIFKRIQRPVLVEASEWGYHSWPFHSRIGAWDYPNWGLKRFIDLHCASNERYRKSSLLPAQLGWWALFGPSGNRDAQLPDEVEYLCCKALAHDMPMSFQAVRATGRPQNARQDEFLALIGRYERLRLRRHFPEAVRAKLREPGAEFRLVREGDEWRLVPTDYAVHKVTGQADGSRTWTVRNRFAAQPARLRVQALYSVEPYDSADALVLADFARPRELPVRSAAAGVEHSLTATREAAKAGEVSGCYTARSARKSRRGAWARAGKAFTPHADLRKYGAVGLWVRGDGQGELLNVQLTTPRQYYRAIDEHYVTIGFVGWRYVELLFRERDAARHGDYVWPYPGHYAVFRAPLVRNHVNGLNLYLNALPPGKEARVLVSAIKALRTRAVELTNPAVEIGGKRILFPAGVAGGGYIEMDSAADCRLYDARGALVRKIKPRGRVPLVAAGDNTVCFTCEGPKGVSARARVTVITSGPALGGGSGNGRD